MTSFTSQYLRTLQALFGKCRKPQGLSQKTIETVEKRLGIVLPRALREFYKTIGGERRLVCCYNRFREPGGLSIQNERLIFGEENQGVVVWGIERKLLRLPDPPVFQGSPDGHIWFREGVTLSDFFQRALCWQCVNGGMKYRFSGIATRQVIRNAFTSLSAIGNTHVGDRYDLRALAKGGVTVCFVGRGKDSFAYSASNSKRALIAACEFIGIPTDE